VDILLEKYGPLALKKGQKPVTDALGHYVIGLTGGTSPRLSLHCHKASTKRTLVYYRGEGVYICGCCNADVTALRSEYKQRIEETQQPLKEEAKMEESNVEAEPQDPYVVHRKKPETVTKEQEGSAVVALGKNDPIQCPQCGVKASRLAYEPTVSGFVSRLLCPYCGKPIEEHQ
jgi:DNA-directed RNA polymerase subunit RPC12/RpoP